MFRYVACLLLLLSFSALHAETLSSGWIELGEGGKPIARIVVREVAECPPIQIDGQPQAMAPRQPVPSGLRPACEFAIPSSARTASVNGQKLVLPKANPSKVVTLGDTGCRVNQFAIQNCNNPDQWPFEQVASRAAKERPDLVIHVGDYLYREIPCPAASQTQCGGTPAGDNWEAWNADFFTPAAKLLAAAPWVFARGNHEDCNRSWRGWFYYLDPRPWNPVCEPYSAPYTIQLGTFPLVLIDSSAVLEDSLDEVQVQKYAAQFASIKTKNAWLVDHHPFWGFKPGTENGSPLLISVPLEAAWDKQPPIGIDMVLSGHVHLFELLTFSNGRPAQLIAGTGGTNLVMAIQKSVDGTLAHGATVMASGSQSEFGYTLLKKYGDNWKLELKSRKGKALFKYPLQFPK